MKKIVHISDTHGQHSGLTIQECDILIHSGDIGGGRTTTREIAIFCDWFARQPAKIKLFIAGNHDHALSEQPPQLKTNYDYMARLHRKNYLESMNIIDRYAEDGVVYLQDSLYEWEGINFYGSPYTPSYYPEVWVYNADRGAQIQAAWNKIPAETNVLITHGPPMGYLDLVTPNYLKEDESEHRGCQNLLYTIPYLKDLKMHLFGHLHQNFAIRSNESGVLFSNGAVCNNRNWLVNTIGNFIIYKD